MSKKICHASENLPCFSLHISLTDEGRACFTGKGPEHVWLANGLSTHGVRNPCSVCTSGKILIVFYPSYASLTTTYHQLPSLSLLSFDTTYHHLPSLSCYHLSSLAITSITFHHLPSISIITIIVYYHLPSLDMTYCHYHLLSLTTTWQHLQTFTIIYHYLPSLSLDITNYHLWNMTLIFLWG